MQSGFEFEPSAADVTKIVAEYAELGAVRYRVAGFVELLLVDHDAASENERLGTFACGGESALNEQFVEPYLHLVGHREEFHVAQGCGKQIATKAFGAS